MLAAYRIGMRGTGCLEQDAWNDRASVSEQLHRFRWQRDRSALRSVSVSHCVWIGVVDSFICESGVFHSFPRPQALQRFFGLEDPDVEAGYSMLSIRRSVTGSSKEGEQLEDRRLGGTARAAMEIFQKDEPIW